MIRLSELTNKKTLNEVEGFFCILFALELNRRAVQFDFENATMRNEILTGVLDALASKKTVTGITITGNPNQVALDFLENKLVHIESFQKHEQFVTPKRLPNDRYEALALLAFYVCEFFRGVLDQPLVFDFSSENLLGLNKVQDLLVARWSVPFISEQVHVLLPAKNVTDLEFGAWNFYSRIEGRADGCSVVLKRELLESLGFTVGGIFVLWQRRMVGRKGWFGSLVRFDGVHDSNGGQVAEFLIIPVGLNGQVVGNTFVERVPLASLGVHTFWGGEDSLLCFFEFEEVVVVDGVARFAGDVVLGGLKSLGIEFNEESLIRDIGG